MIMIFQKLKKQRRYANRFIMAQRNKLNKDLEIICASMTM